MIKAKFQESCKKSVDSRSLVYFGFSRLSEMKDKGNVWYVRHYEEYFDKVYVLYLLGTTEEPVSKGNTHLISLGGQNTKLDLILAPFRLYRFAKKFKPTSYLTADLVFSWWTAWLVKVFLKAKIYLMPVCMPKQIYRNTHKSMSGIPIWLESVLIACSFMSADKVLTGLNCGGFVGWLKSYRLARKKLIVVDVIVDGLTTIEFLDRLQEAAGNRERPISESKEMRIIYVGRFHREKQVEHLIKMMSVINKEKPESFSIKLVLVGEGPEKAALTRLAEELHVEKSIEFTGVVANGNLPDYLLGSDGFVSPLTGTSLREAAMCGLPIIAYDVDWISGLLIHEDTALLVPPDDYEKMASEVIRLAIDAKLRRRLSENIRKLALRMWSLRGLKQSLRLTFEEVEQDARGLGETKQR